jgi:hypothetical protein
VGAEGQEEFVAACAPAPLPQKLSLKEETEALDGSTETSGGIALAKEGKLHASSSGALSSQQEKPSEMAF